MWDQGLGEVRAASAVDPSQQTGRGPGAWLLQIDPNPG